MGEVSEHPPKKESPPFEKRLGFHKVCRDKVNGDTPFIKVFKVIIPEFVFNEDCSIWPDTIKELPDIGRIVHVTTIKAEGVFSFILSIKGLACSNSPAEAQWNQYLLPFETDAVSFVSSFICFSKFLLLL